MTEGESAGPDEETVVRPRRERPASAPVSDDDRSGVDDDTVIRTPTSRTPTARTSATRTPVLAPPALVPPALVPPASVPPATVPPTLIEPQQPIGSVADVLDPPDPPRERIFAYGFRVNNGRAVSLETPVLIGRAPTPPRILTAEPPLLARVESPHKEVSGTHLELRQQGTLVIATDLRSTNGTTVTPPGRDTQKLRQGESVVVQPGTVIDIGDGNVVEILPLQSRESS